MSIFRTLKNTLQAKGLHIDEFRGYMAEIQPIWLKTPSNQYIDFGTTFYINKTLNFLNHYGN